VLEDLAIQGDMRLFKDGIKLLASKGNKLYSLRTRA